MPLETLIQDLQNRIIAPMTRANMVLRVAKAEFRGAPPKHDTGPGSQTSGAYPPPQPLLQDLRAGKLTLEVPQSGCRLGGFPWAGFRPELCEIKEKAYPWCQADMESGSMA